MRGNSAILKCMIPSFVADFVQVIGWIDEEGQEFLPSSEGSLNMGKFLMKKFEELKFFELFPDPVFVFNFVTLFYLWEIK